MTYWVHPSAVVDDGVEIGDATKIWHWTHVCTAAKIGSHCSLGQNVYVGSRALIGNGVKIQNNVSVYDDVVLEDDVFCGPSMVFTNVINPRAFVQRKDEYKATFVRKGASLGANSTIVCGVTVGQFALVGAGAVVTRDIPDFALVVGAPARQIGWVSAYGNRIELPLTGDGNAICRDDGSSYRLRGGVMERA
jgi:UDP-2-acetamido-3-amino-2,3-dideoxy-glucuronate N-acetyltransferase